MSLVRYAVLLPIVIIFRTCWMEHALEIIQAFTLSSRRDFITILCEHLVMLDCFLECFWSDFFCCCYFRIKQYTFGLQFIVLFYSGYMFSLLVCIALHVNAYMLDKKFLPGEYCDHC